MCEKIQFEMLEGLINSLAKRIDKLDGILRGISREREFLYKYGKELNCLIKLMKPDITKIHSKFLEYLDAIEEQGLSIDQVRDIIEKKIEPGGT